MKKNLFLFLLTLLITLLLTQPSPAFWGTNVQSADIFLAPTGGKGCTWNNHAYLVNRMGLVVYVMQDNLQHIRNVPLPQKPNCITTDGRLLAIGSSGIILFRLDNQLIPHLVYQNMTLDEPESVLNVKSIALNGDYMYLLEADQLLTYSVRTPSHPVLRNVQDIDFEGDAPRLAVSENALYLLANSLFVYDISDPNSPEFTTSLDNQSFDENYEEPLIAMGTYEPLCIHENWLIGVGPLVELWDISDPLSPESQGGIMNNENSFWGCAFIEDYMILSQQDYFYVYNVDLERENPLDLIEFYETESDEEDAEEGRTLTIIENLLFCQGGYKYLYAGEGLWDRIDPHSLPFLENGRVRVNAGRVGDVTIADRNLFFSGCHGLVGFRISDADLTPVYYDTDNHFFNMFGNESAIYTGNRAVAEVWNAGNHDNFHRVRVMDPALGRTPIRINNRLVASIPGGSITVADCSDPLDPTVRVTSDLPPVERLSGTAAVFCGSSSLNDPRFLEFFTLNEDGWTVEHRHSYELNGWITPGAFDMEGDIVAYVIEDQLTLSRYSGEDELDELSVIEVAEVNGMSTIQPKIVDGVLYVFTNNYIDAWQIDDPENPENIGRFYHQYNDYQQYLTDESFIIQNGVVYFAGKDYAAAICFGETFEPEPAEHTIHLERGYNLISTFVEPYNDDLRDVLQPIWGDLGIFKDEHGGFIAPDWGFGNISQWVSLRGYQIRVHEVCDLVIAGTAIDPTTPIELHPTWNMVAYLPAEAVSATTAFQNIENNLIIVKDERGRFYLPAFNFDNMGLLHRGKAYLVKVTEADELVWNIEEGEQLMTMHKTFQPPVHFDPVTLTDNNMSLLITDAPVNTELGIFSIAGLLVGSVNLNGSAPHGTAIFGDDPLTEGVDGALADASLEFRLWDGVSERVVSPDFIEGNGDYLADGLTIISLKGEVNLPTELTIEEPYPNPFNSTVRLAFTLPEADNVKFAVYDLAGREVASLATGMQQSGRHTLTWKADNFAAGVYIARLETSTVSRTVKMVMIQ